MNVECILAIKQTLISYKLSHNTRNKEFKKCAAIKLSKRSIKKSTFFHYFYVDVNNSKTLLPFTHAHMQPNANDPKFITRFKLAC